MVMTVCRSTMEREDADGARNSDNKKGINNIIHQIYSLNMRVYLYI